jgi:hypothetical protein
MNWFTLIKRRPSGYWSNPVVNPLIREAVKDWVEQAPSGSYYFGTIRRDLEPFLRDIFKRHIEQNAEASHHGASALINRTIKIKDAEKSSFDIVIGNELQRQESNPRLTIKRPIHMNAHYKKFDFILGAMK